MKKIATVPTREDIINGHDAIKGYVHRTPVVTSASISSITSANIFFKCENFQKVGAFKARGATCAALSLNKDELKNGIATHSSGNHAQAIALTAKNLGVKAYIVMPSNSPQVKKDATKGYGAEIIECEPTLEARESSLKEVVKRTSATEIHPYDNYNIICGQATAAKELLEDVEQLDVIIAPIGGGGLMSGTALSAKYFGKDVTVIGAEPELVNDAYRSFEAGYIIKNISTDTIADGLKTNLCEKTFAIIQNHVSRIITVSEQEIVDAMKLIWERLKIVVEPSAAVPLAAVLKSKDQLQNLNVGIILSGGNVDLRSLPF